MKFGRWVRAHWMDIAFSIVVVWAVAYVLHRASTVLHYKWNWAMIPQFLVRFDEQSRMWVANLLLEGLLATVRMSLWSAIGAGILGLAMGLARTSRNLFLLLVSRSYVELMRNAPPLVIIFVFYYFVSSQIVPLLGVDEFIREASPLTLALIRALCGPPELVASFVSAVICLSIFESAYVTEIVRAGIESIGRGQWEAASSLGLSGAQAMRRIVLPQAIQRVVPPLAGQFISLVKDTSLASLVSIQELAFMSAQVAATTARVFEVWITASLLYLGLCLGLALLFERFEKRLARGVR